MSGFEKALVGLKKIFAVLTSFFVLIIGLAEPGEKPDYYEPVSKIDFVLFDALVRAQGITTDGEHFYFSENYGFIKTELDGHEIVEMNIIAIPPELLELGCKHIGGISYYDGKIYCTIEDSKVFEHLYIAVFDAETLELIKYKAVPLENHENGIPWCVVDPDTGLLYSARRDYITQLNVYDSDTLELVDVVDIVGADAPEIQGVHEVPGVHKVQGGECRDGILYLSVSREQQAIFAVKLATGQVLKVFDRNLADGVEGEGITILPMDNGAFFHVLDIGALRVNVHLRSYAFDPDTLAWD